MCVLMECNVSFELIDERVKRQETDTRMRGEAVALQSVHHVPAIHMVLLQLTLD
jgi:hypothetical protein